MTEESKSPKKKRASRKPKISFSANHVVSQDIAPTAEALTKHMRNVMNQQKDILEKSVEAVKSTPQKGYDRSKVVFSSRAYSGSYDGVESKDWRRLSDSELKELSQVDPYISAIISTRVSQAAVIGRPSDSKFDKGTRIYELDPITEDDFPDPALFEITKDKRKKQMQAIMRWVMNCGTDNEELINAAFTGADTTFKKCSFAEFLCAQVRNLLTFGRCATQIFRNPEGAVIMFRPAPVETIYHLLQGEAIHLSVREDTMDQSIEDVNEYNALQEEERPAAFIQRVDGQNINAFTERDMQIWHFQKQALFDLDGYMLAPIEQAIYMVFTHQQTLNYLRNSFVKGLASKGILNLKVMDAAGQLSDEDLDQLRREFHNFASRNDNSATTPVISGPVEVSWIPLQSTPRDMEFLSTEEHIIRALCSAMLISPQEMGYGHLSQNQGSLTSSNKQEEIVRGEERGLRMLLDTIYDGLNSIISENFPDFEKLYRVTYVGVGEDTRDTVIARQAQELQTTATLSSLYADSEKNEPVPFGGNVPLSPTFHQNVVRYMKYGELREYFFGDKGASKRPEYDFIIDPQLQQSYAQLKVQPIEMQQEGAELQLKAQEQQMQAQDQQMQMQEQQAQAGMTPWQTGPEQDTNQDQPAQPWQSDAGNAQQEEPQEKSLAEAFKERNILAKSMSSYFSEWIKAHNKV
jgi:hypothetical protein